MVFQVLFFIFAANAMLVNVDFKTVYVTEGINRLITSKGIIDYVNNGTDPITVSTSLYSVSDGVCADRPILSGALQVATGTRHACVRTLKNVFCWGDNGFCQLLDNPTSLHAVMILGGMDLVRNEIMQKMESIVIFDTVTCMRYNGSTGGVCWGALHTNSPKCIVTPFEDATFGLFRVGYAVVAVGESRITTVIGATRFTGQKHSFASNPLLLRIVDNALEVVFDDAFIRCSPETCTDVKFEDNVLTLNNSVIFNEVRFNDDTCIIRAGNVYCPDTISDTKWFSPVRLETYVEIFGSPRFNTTGAFIPGCDQEVFLDGVTTGLFTKDEMQEITVDNRCVRVYGCIDIDNFGVPRNVQSVAAGNEHMCVLDMDKEVWCTGKSNRCQFIKNGKTNAAVGWERAFVPWPPTTLAADGDLTCMSNGQDVFCSGCTAAGCICNNGTTLRMGSEVLRVEITKGGFCVISRSDPPHCVGVHGGKAPYRQCQTNGTSTVCGHIVFATRQQHTLVANNMQVAILTDNALCVSRNRLRNVNCSNYVYT